MTQIYLHHCYRCFPIKRTYFHIRQQSSLTLINEELVNVRVYEGLLLIILI